MIGLVLPVEFPDFRDFGLDFDLIEILPPPFVLIMNIIFNYLIIFEDNLNYGVGGDAVVVVDDDDASDDGVG